VKGVGLVADYVLIPTIDYIELERYTQLTDGSHAQYDKRHMGLIDQ